MNIVRRDEMSMLKIKILFISSLFSLESLDSRECKATLDQFLDMLDIFGI